MKRPILLTLLAGCLLGCIKQETVAPAPTAAIQFSGGDFGRYQFTASGTNIESYKWDFGDGRTDVEPNPVHAFDYNQTYSIKLTVTNKAGATASATRAITVTNVRGGATFWMQSGAYQIDVTIDDTYLATITKLHADTPNCDVSGAANFPFLTEGVHSYVARQKTGNPLVWRGTLTTTGGYCQTLRMKY